MRLKKILPILALSLALCGCSDKAPEQFYEFKSAITTQLATAGDVTASQTIYIEDYGQKEYQYSREGSYLSAKDGKYSYSIFLDHKMGMKAANSEVVVNYLNLSKEAIEEYGIEEIGQEEIDGRMCTKYTICVTTDETVLMTEWVYKGFILQSEFTGEDGTVYTVRTIDFQENAEIPSEKVTIPPGVSIQDVTPVEG